MAESSNVKERTNHLDLIKAIKTPLGFFVLIVLVIESFSLAAIGLNYIDQDFFLFQSKAILVMGVIVALIALFRPSSLFGVNIRERILEYSDDVSINQYMKDLICSGSTLDIVSNRLRWVSEDEEVRKTILERAQVSSITIYIPRKNEISKILEDGNVNVNIVKSLGDAPNARFTLVDGNRPGGAMLAIGFGRIPKYKIQEFTEVNYPHVIALARDYVDLLKGRSG